MKILLCAATKMEIAPTIQFLSLRENVQVEILITGVGLMASTYALTKEVAAHRPEIIIQLGIAGAIDKELKLADVVTVKTETVGDLGAQEQNGFQSLFDLNLVDGDSHPWRDRQLINDSVIVDDINLQKVSSVTVNEISTTEQIIHYYKHHLKAQIETMEGAALHYIALMEGIPFLQLRSVSNFIGERDKTKWQMTEAIRNLNGELQNLLTKHFNL